MNVKVTDMSSCTQVIRVKTNQVQICKTRNYIMEPEPAYMLMWYDMGVKSDAAVVIAKIPQVVEMRDTCDIFKVTTDPRTTQKILARVRGIPHMRSANTLRSITSQGGR